MCACAHVFAYGVFACGVCVSAVLDILVMFIIYVKFRLTYQSVLSGLTNIVFFLTLSHSVFRNTQSIYSFHVYRMHLAALIYLCSGRTLLSEDSLL